MLGLPFAYLVCGDVAKPDRNLSPPSQAGQELSFMMVIPVFIERLSCREPGCFSSVHDPIILEAQTEGKGHSDLVTEALKHSVACLRPHSQWQGQDLSFRFRTAAGIN
jgi:hypothetical protein